MQGLRLCIMYASDWLNSRIHSTFTQSLWHNSTQRYRTGLFRILDKNQDWIVNKTESAWTDGERVENAPVFTFWYQGLESAPPLVRICIESMKEHIGDHPLVVITKENIREYADIPDFIYEKVDSGKITLTHFSDILRFSLLAKHGGLWLDATILLNRDIDEDIFLNPFFSVKAVTDEDAAFRFIGTEYWCGFLCGAFRNNSLVSLMKDLMCDYWSHNDIQFDYFLIDFYFAYCYRTSAEVRRLVSTIRDEQIFYLSSRLADEFNSDFLNEFRRVNPCFNKLSYKVRSRSDNDVLSMIIKSGGKCLQ